MIQRSEPQMIEEIQRIYLEPTSYCNLDCVTCMRNTWEEPLGRMSSATFSRFLDDLNRMPNHPLVFLGGIGEPLAHPDLAQMLAGIHATGSPIELITNGIALTEKLARSMINNEVQRLWVSLDGASPQSYTDVRLGAELPAVISNIRRLNELKEKSGKSLPTLGIAFVAMRRNITDLPKVIDLGRGLGATQFSISNVLAYSPELRGESLYSHSQYSGINHSSQRVPAIDLPRMDLNSLTRDAIEQVLHTPAHFSLAGASLDAGINACPFIRKGSISIRWDGAVSPCLALLHTHTSYLDDRERRSDAFLVGHLEQGHLQAIWSNPDYQALRQRLQEFDFSPCVFCNSCDMAGSNQQDCFGSPAPACGGCLWAQGIIQCP